MFFLPGGEVILFRVNSLKLKGLQFNIRYFISGEQRMSMNLVSVYQLVLT